MNSKSGILPSQIIRRLSLDCNLIQEHNFDDCLSPASYELRVGSYSDANQRKILTPGEVVSVSPHSHLLLGTIEQVHLPLDIVGMMYLRSTYARLGMMPWFQGLVDPGYEGALTVVLHNMTNRTLDIAWGEQVCHIVFERMLAAADHAYSGAYVKSLGAQTAVMEPRGSRSRPSRKSARQSSPGR